MAAKKTQRPIGPKTQMAPKMCAEQFQFIADIIARVNWRVVIADVIFNKDVDLQAEIAKEFAYSLALTNPNFDRPKFLHAAIKIIKPSSPDRTVYQHNTTA